MHHVVKTFPPTVRILNVSMDKIKPARPACSVKEESRTEEKRGRGSISFYSAISTWSLDSVITLVV